MILVFGSLNMDLVFRVEALPSPGETVLTDAYATVPGGKGANQAVAAARALGTAGAVGMAGCVGEDAFGAALIEALQASGVEVDLMRRCKAPTGCASIGVDAAGRNAITVASGANREAKASQVADALLSPGTLVLLQHEVALEENLALARRAKARGARVILNAAPARPLPSGQWRGLLDVLIVNETELAALAGSGSDPAARLAGELDTALVATLGENGALLVDKGQSWSVGALPLERVVDTTAAGDSFVGAFASALAQGLDLPSALHRGSVAGGLACTRLGAQSSIPARAEIEARRSDLPPPRRT